MQSPSYHQIARHYEDCLDRYGDTHRGVDWPKAKDAETRYRVMLELLRDSDPITLLDFGCGAGHLLDYMIQSQIPNVEYSGLDISEKFVTLCHSKYPEHTFVQMDVLTDASSLEHFDYIVANGVFTEKRNLSFQQMWLFVRNVISILWSRTRRGLAFNVMSTHVDWERDDLFHLPFDDLADFLTDKVSRNFIFRNDYGLFEYTAYVYR